MATMGIKQLETLVDDLNRKLTRVKHNKRIVVDPRNGFKAVDLFNIETDKTERNLQTGNAQTCANAARAYVGNVMEEIAMSFFPVGAE